MQYRQDHFCCTSIQMGDFGEGEDCHSYDYCVLRINRAIAHATSNGHAMVTCHTTQCQKPLNRALRDAGFKRTRFYKKKKHSRTVVALWHKPIHKDYN